MPAVRVPAARAVVPLLTLLFAMPAARAHAQAAAADSAWTAGDRSRARKLYEQVLDRDSADTQALLRLALLEGWAGRPEAALAHLDRLLLLAPRDIEARALRARMLARAGRFEEGRALADSLLAAHPADVAALQERARFAQADGEPAAAERFWRAALERDPDNVDTQLGLARSLRTAGRPHEARTVLQAAARTADPGAELGMEYARIRQALGPRTRAVAGYESDSDGNRMTTLALSGGVRASARLEINADVYVRSSELEAAPGVDAQARGGSVAVSVLLPGGWRLGAGAGGNDVRGAGGNGGGHGTLTLHASSPARARLTAALTIARVPFDYTRPMIENDVRADEARLELGMRPGRDWTLAAAAGLARFDVRDGEQSNARVSVEATARRTLNDRLSLALETRGFGFDRDVDGGYFDPSFYGLFSARLAWRAELDRLVLDADVAPGLQRIGEGDVRGAFHAAADLSLIVRPGRSVGLRAVYANTGLQQLSAAGETAYRYASIGLHFAWWF